MTVVREFAAAKLNLYLRVTGRREDGYHLLDSLVAFAAVGDVLTAEPADRFSLSIDGPFAGPLQAAVKADGSDNLVVRAATRLAEVTGVRAGARIALAKNLPVAAGIGGGSADAAATLRALCRLWSLDLAASDLARMGLALGADIPVCLGSRPAMMSGIGDILTPAPPLPPVGLVLVNPGVAVATAAVFSARHGPFSAPAAITPPAPRSARELADMLAPLGNDLTPAALSLAPAIAEVLGELADSPNCLLARLSGSGPTCFGLFPDLGMATKAAGALAAARPHWWIEPTRLMAQYAH